MKNSIKAINTLQLRARACGGVSSMCLFVWNFLFILKNGGNSSVPRADVADVGALWVKEVLSFQSL